MKIMSAEERAAKDKVLAGLGLKHEARTVVVVGYYWTARTKAQAADRAYRVGTNDAVHQGFAVAEPPGDLIMPGDAADRPTFGVTVLVNTDETPEAVEARFEKMCEHGEKWSKAGTKLLSESEAAEMWLQTATYIAEEHQKAQGGRMGRIV
jgi:hypothetical protein